MVFQSYALWPHMTVAQNMGYGLRLRGVGRAQIAERIAALLAMLALAAVMIFIGNLIIRRITSIRV